MRPALRLALVLATFLATAFAVPAPTVDASPADESFQACACENGIESVRKNAADAARFEKRTSSRGEPYFVLKAGNGQEIGRSETYSSDAACQNGIESVAANATNAEVVDTTQA